MSQREGLRSPLPEHFVEAERYYVELRKDPQWLKAHMGEYLAIMGREIVGQADNFQDLASRVFGTYGYGSIFMPHVTEHYPQVIRLRPRIRRIADKQ